MWKRDKAKAKADYAAWYKNHKEEKFKSIAEWRRNHKDKVNATNRKSRLKTAMQSVTKL